MKPGKFILLEGISGSGKSTLAKLLVEGLKARGIDAILNTEPTKKSSFGRAVRMIIEGNEVPSELLAEFKEDVAFLEVALDTSAYRVTTASRERVNQFRCILSCVPGKLERGKELTELERQILFIADRFFDLKGTIIPALREGKWVVQDRYDLSNYAYGSAHFASFELLYELHLAALGDKYRVPDITFFVDVTPRVAAGRLKRSGKPIDLHEGLESLKKVRVQYEEAIKRQDTLPIIVGTHRPNVVRLNGAAPIKTVIREAEAALLKAKLLKK